MPLVHHVFTVEEENAFYQRNPGVHLVKAVVSQSGKVHIWVADNKRFNGGHMQSGGAPNV